MLNPNSLRKKSEEAVERIARERQLEEERLRREAEARRLEEERLRQLEAERAQWRKLAKQTTAKLIRQAIQSAAQGGRTTQVVVAPELPDYLQGELETIGLDCIVTHTSKWDLATEERVSRLLLKLGEDGPAVAYKCKFVEELSAGRSGAEELLNLIMKLKKDSEIVLSSDAESYIRSSLKPHLESEAPDVPLDRVDVSWKRIDVAEALLTELHQVPSWLLSAGGSGLIQRLGECTVSDAEKGCTHSTFELVPLPINPDRWGHNRMTKFVHSGVPIGVTPFSAEIMAQAIEALSFKATLAVNTSPSTLTITW